MAEKMNHIERTMASLAGEPIDRMLVYPLAMGVLRRLVPGYDGKLSYKDWSENPKLFAQAFIEGQKYFDFDLAIGLMDLSVGAADFGAKVRMDDQNTPFVTDAAWDTVEGYETLEVPDITKGRSGVLIEGTQIFCGALKDEAVCTGFLEGPLLTLTQCAHAEKVFMDMNTSPSAIHKALKVITDYNCDMVTAMNKNRLSAGLAWDLLWGNYACLGDKEYGEFEGNDKYIGRVIKATNDSGQAYIVHNCSDLPHLQTQTNTFHPVVNSMAWYPLIAGSPSPTDVIKQGYADKCLIAGVIETQGFIRWSKEKMEKTTMNLIQEVKTAMCERGLKSTYAISSGCEIPPTFTTKMENIGAVVEMTKKYGQIPC